MLVSQATILIPIMCDFGSLSKILVAGNQEKRYVFLGRVNTQEYLAGTFRKDNYGRKH